MEGRLDRLEEKLDKLVDIQTQIQVDVAEHIRRTALAEESIEKLGEAIQPIQKHVAIVHALGRLLAWAVGIIAAIATTYGALK